MSNEDTLGYASNSAVARILLRHDLQIVVLCVYQSFLSEQVTPNWLKLLEQCRFMPGG